LHNFLGKKFHVGPVLHRFNNNKGISLAENLIDRAGRGLLPLLDIPRNAPGAGVCVVLGAKGSVAMGLD
jgi:hypothetical protein